MFFHLQCCQHNSKMYGFWSGLKTVLGRGVFFIMDCHICHEEKVGCTSFSVCLSSFQVVPTLC